MSPIRLRKFRNQPITAARFIRSVKYHFAENISVPHHVKPQQVHAILNDILEPLSGISEEMSEAEYSHSERFVYNALRMLAGLRVLKLYPWILSSVYTFGYFLISRREKDRICMEAYDCIRKGETLTTSIVRHVVNNIIFSDDNVNATDDDENCEALTKNDIENFRRTLQRNCCKRELQVLAEWPKGLGFMWSSNEYENMENEMRHFFKLFEINNSISSDSIEGNCKSISSKPSQHMRNLGDCSSENENEVEVEEIFSINPQHQSYNKLHLISIRLNTNCIERKHIEESKRNNNNLRTKRYKNETLKKIDALKNKNKNTRKKLRKKINKKVLPLKADIKSVADKSNNFENRCTEESSINENNLGLESNTNNELHKVVMLERRKKYKKMIIKDRIADRTRSKNKILLKKLDIVDQELKDKSGEIIENNNVTNDDEFTCKRVIPFVGKTVRKPLYGGPERPIQVDCSVPDTICSSENLNKKLPGLSSEVTFIAQISSNREQESTSSQDAERKADVLFHNMCTKLASSKNVNGQLSSSSCANDTEHLKKACVKLLGKNMYTNKRKLNAHLEKDHTNAIETNDVVTSESGIAAPTMNKENQDNNIAVNQNSANIATNQNTFQVDHLMGQPEDQSNVKGIHLNSRSNSPSMVSTIPLANTNSNFTAQINDSDSSRKVYLTVKYPDLKSIEIRENNTSSTLIPRTEMANDTTSAHSFSPDPLKIINQEQSQLEENTDDKFSTKRTLSVCQSEKKSINEPQNRLNSSIKQKQAMLNAQASLTGPTSKRTSITQEDLEIEPSLLNSKKMKQQPQVKPNVKMMSPNSSSDSPAMEIPVSVATLNTNLTAEDNDIEVEIVEIRKSNTSSKSIPKIKTSNDTASSHTFAPDPLKILNANISKNSNDKTAATMNKVTLLSTQASLTEINKVNPVDQVNPLQIHQNSLQYQPQLCSATSYNNVKNNTDSSIVNNSTLNFRSNILQHTVSNYFDRRGPPPPYPSLSIASNRSSSSQLPRELTISKTFQTNTLLPTPSKNMSTGIHLPSNPAVKVYSKKSRTKPRILKNVRISRQEQLNFQFNTKRYSRHLSDVRHSSLANISSTSSNYLQSQEQQQSVSQGKPQQNHYLHQQIHWQQQQQCHRTNEAVTLVSNDWQTFVNPKQCYVCDYCPDHLTFEFESLLRKHMDVDHNYFCELCQNRYPSQQELLQHVGVHLGIYTCEIPDIVRTQDL